MTQRELTLIVQLGYVLGRVRRAGGGRHQHPACASRRSATGCGRRMMAAGPRRPTVDAPGGACRPDHHDREGRDGRDTGAGREWTPTSSRRRGWPTGWPRRWDRGPRHATAAARRLTDEELTLGLAFLARVIEIASMSSRALADVQRERQRAGARAPAQLGQAAPARPSERARSRRASPGGRPPAPRRDAGAVPGARERREPGARCPPETGRRRAGRPRRSATPAPARRASGRAGSGPRAQPIGHGRAHHLHPGQVGGEHRDPHLPDHVALARPGPDRIDHAPSPARRARRIAPDGAPVRSRPARPSRRAAPDIGVVRSYQRTNSAPARYGKISPSCRTRGVSANTFIEPRAAVQLLAERLPDRVVAQHVLPRRHHLHRRQGRLPLEHRLRGREPVGVPAAGA